MTPTSLLLGILALGIPRYASMASSAISGSFGTWRMQVQVKPQYGLTIQQYLSVPSYLLYGSKRFVAVALFNCINAEVDFLSEAKRERR